MTTWLGLFFGNVLVHYKGHRDRLKVWFPMATIWFLVGIFIQLGGWEMSKQVWSPRFDKERKQYKREDG